MAILAGTLSAIIRKIAVPADPGLSNGVDPVRSPGYRDGILAMAAGTFSQWADMTLQADALDIVIVIARWKFGMR